MISLCLNNNKKHAVPPPRLYCPKVGEPEKNSMSHCTALLKNYCLGPFKDEKEMKFVQNCFAKVFFHPKNVYDNPKISWRTYVTLRYWTFVTLYGNCRFDTTHLKWPQFCSKKVRSDKIMFPKDNQLFGINIKQSDPYCDFPYSVTHFWKIEFLRFFLQLTRGFGLFHQNM